jgi:hypothetical protein
MGEPPKPRVRRPSNFRQQDVARAIKAAKSSGLDIARVEVDPVSQKIVMTMKDCTVTETNINPYDSAPVDDPALRRRGQLMIQKIFLRPVTHLREGDHGPRPHQLIERCPSQKQKPGSERDSKVGGESM